MLAEALDANGKIISKYSLSSANAEIVLHVSAEKKVLKANGKDLCYIPIEFSDADGNLKPYIEQRVEIEVKGSATLAGFGSALCKTDEVFIKIIMIHIVEDVWLLYGQERFREKRL